MLIAMNHQEELILADATLNKSTDYRCPSCKGRVHLKVGAVIRPHFAHFKKEACAVFSEGETEEHIEGKLQLSRWLQHLNLEVEVEAYLPKLQQRPDLLVTIGNRKIALEFQCSSIPIQKVVERTKGYLDAGYEVVWILGEQFKYTKQLTAFHKACLTQFDQQLVLFHYSVFKQRLEYRYNFHLQQNQKMRCAKRSLRSGGKLAFTFEKGRPLKEPLINIELEHQKLLRQFLYPSEKTKQFQQLLYENQESVISMPKELYGITPSEWTLQNHPFHWKLHFIIWLENFPIQTVLTKRMIERWLRETKLLLYDIPQATTKQKHQPIYELMHSLVQAGVLKRIRLDKWSIVQYPKRFRHLEEKFRVKSLQGSLHEPSPYNFPVE